MPFAFHGHPLSSYCWKVLIALYENATPFDFKLIDLGDPESAGAFFKLWAMGKMPVLEDAERGLAIPESSIIIEHLDRVAPGAVRFLPGDPDQAREVRLWDRFYDQYVMSPMQAVVANRIRPAEHRDPFGVDNAVRLLRTAYDVADKALANRAWAAGENFSLADCAAAPSLYYADKVAPFTATHPALAAYLERLKARPSFARVLEEAKPYEHMFPQEPLPEPA